MRKYGLIGYPLGHSFSQNYFTEKFARESITGCSYDNYPIAVLDEFQGLIKNNPSLCGLNVTIPYKTGILKYADIKDAAVKEIGAANVLKIRRERSKIHISAFNSDVTGIEDSLKPFLSGGSLKSAMILGTGGSSLAVSYVLEKLGLRVTRVSRIRKTGIISYHDITAELINKSQLIINTTPLGMFPDISSKPDINYSLLDQKHILFDLVYNPEITLFLKMGQERGCTIIPGLKMLYSQAERSWEIWNDDNL
jgi:shikimate dehydrogenase